VHLVDAALHAWHIFAIFQFSNSTFSKEASRIKRLIPIFLYSFLESFYGYLYLLLSCAVTSSYILILTHVIQPIKLQSHTMSQYFVTRKLKNKVELIIDSWQKLVRHPIRRHFNYITFARTPVGIVSPDKIDVRQTFIAADRCLQKRIHCRARRIDLCRLSRPISAVFLCGRRISIPRRII